MSKDRLPIQFGRREPKVRSLRVVGCWPPIDTRFPIAVETTIADSDKTDITSFKTSISTFTILGTRYNNP